MLEECSIYVKPPRLMVHTSIYIPFKSSPVYTSEYLCDFISGQFIMWQFKGYKED